jgi:hypothetical protein
MTTSHSKTRFEQLVVRLCEWAKARKLAESDIDMIIDVVSALRSADEALCAAGFFACAVAAPRKLRFTWESGQTPFDPAAALKQFKKSADYIIWAVDAELFGPNPRIPNPPAPQGKYYYLLISNGAKVRFDSPVPMGVEEVCRMGLQTFIQAGFRFGDMLRISICDAEYKALETVEVPANEQLRKAGLVDPERGDT